MLTFCWRGLRFKVIGVKSFQFVNSGLKPCVGAIYRCQIVGITREKLTEVERAISFEMRNKVVHDLPENLVKERMAARRKLFPDDSERPVWGHS